MLMTFLKDGQYVRCRRHPRLAMANNFCLFRCRDQFIEASGQPIGLVVRHLRIASQPNGGDLVMMIRVLHLKSDSTLQTLLTWKKMASGNVVRATWTHPTGHYMHRRTMYDCRPSLFTLYPRDTVLLYLVICPPCQPPETD